MVMTRSELDGLDPQNFWSRVNKNGPIPEHQPHLGNCWIFGERVRRYRSIRVNQRWCLVHRISYIFSVGDIPIGKIICHRCDMPSCVRPEHIYPGTYSDNRRDWFAHGKLVERSDVFLPNPCRPPKKPECITSRRLKIGMRIVNGNWLRSVPMREIAMWDRGEAVPYSSRKLIEKAAAELGYSRGQEP
jgi:hypothetical protein